MIENPWVIAIVAGIISTIIGGIVLGRMGKFSSYHVGAVPLVLVSRLCLWGVVSIIFFAMLFGTIIPPGEFSFGMNGIDPIIRILLFIFAEVATFSSIVLKIDIFNG